MSRRVARRSSQAQMSAEHCRLMVATWNENVEVGAAVTYTDDVGAEIATRTRSAAWMLGDHTPVVQLEGKPGSLKSGCYLLDRVVAS